MKISACMIFLILMMNAAIAQDSAQRTPRTVSQSMDLVVEVPKLNADHYAQLKGRLTKLNSLSVEGYCNSEKLIYLRFNPDQYFNVLVAINEAGYAYYIKRNTSIARGIEA
jgi:hypothetical protein